MKRKQDREEKKTEEGGLWGARERTEEGVVHSAWLRWEVRQEEKRIGPLDLAGDDWDCDSDSWGGGAKAAGTDNKRTE